MLYTTQCVDFTPIIATTTEEHLVLWAVCSTNVNKSIINNQLITELNRREMVRMICMYICTTIVFFSTIERIIF